LRRSVDRGFSLKLEQMVNPIYCLAFMDTTNLLVRSVWKHRRYDIQTISNLTFLKSIRSDLKYPDNKRQKDLKFFHEI
jgi:hypothetical protein